jgi:predicted secreted protein
MQRGGQLEGWEMRTEKGGEDAIEGIHTRAWEAAKVGDS